MHLAHAARLLAAVADLSPDGLAALARAAGVTAPLVAWHATPRGPRLAALRWVPAHVAPSDADTLRTLTARAAALLVQAAWLDTLTRDALNARRAGRPHDTGRRPPGQTHSVARWAVSFRAAPPPASGAAPGSAGVAPTHSRHPRGAGRGERRPRPAIS